MSDDKPTDGYVLLLTAVVGRAVRDAAGVCHSTVPPTQYHSVCTEASEWIQWARRELVALADVADNKGRTFRMT